MHGIRLRPVTTAVSPEPPDPSVTNPYTPSHQTEAVGELRSSAALPAGLLLSLLIPTLLYDAWFGYVIASDLVNASKTMGWSFSMVRDWGFLIKVVIVFSAHLFILAGAMRMMRGRSYWFSVAACVMSLIPVLTPALILGIPVAIWGLIVLRRDGVRLTFAAHKT